MRRRFPRFGAAWLLALALLLAQGFGLAHRVAHATPAAGAAAAAVDHDAGGAQCRLLDQLTLADALSSGATPLPAAPDVPPRALQTPPERQAAGPPAAYLARAPPRG